MKLRNVSQCMWPVGAGVLIVFLFLPVLWAEDAQVRMPGSIGTDYELTYSQLIFDSFKTPANYLEQQKLLEAARKNYAQVSVATLFELRSSFVELLRSQKLIEITEDIAKRRQINVNMVNLRYDAGREMGLRKALGARPKDLYLQFSVEAVVICLLGGIIGIAVGVLTAIVVSEVMGWAVLLSMKSIVLAAGFSVAVGLIFGFWPAQKAAKLNPIDALRYE